MLQVTVVCARAGAATEICLTLAAGARVADALAWAIAAGLDAEEVRLAPVGIFGKRCARDTLVKNGDRIEIYRRLIADPKDARRRRAGAK